MVNNKMENELRMTIGDPMILKNYYMPKQYDDWLKAESKRRMITTAQLLRDIIKAEMERQEER